MARRSQMTMLKRQREVKKAEKAAKKRARRHGVPEPGMVSEPRAPIPSGAPPSGEPGPVKEPESGG